MCISSNETTWTMPGGQHGGQKLRVDLSLSIGENKDYYKVCFYQVLCNLWTHTDGYQIFNFSVSEKGVEEMLQM